MRAEAEAVVRLGVPRGALIETRTAFMRYRGQGHEVAVLLPAGPLDPAALRAAFDATYARVYGRVIPGLEIEAVTWTLALAEPYDLPERLPDAGGCACGSRRPDRCRIVEPISGEAVDAVAVRACGVAYGRPRQPDLRSSSRTERQPSCRAVMWCTLALRDELVIEEIEA